jgi:hypothetical protein
MRGQWERGFQVDLLRAAGADRLAPFHATPLACGAECLGVTCR